MKIPKSWNFASCLCATWIISLVLVTGCTKSEQPAGSSAPAGNIAATSASTGADKQLKIEDLKTGTGAEATPGKTVKVHYTGWLTNGNKFDSSLDRGTPFSFKLGSGMVIPGWDQGVAGMKVGGKRKLTIPPDLAYGPMGRPPVIPPNSTLVFEVELLGVTD